MRDSGYAPTSVADTADRSGLPGRDPAGPKPQRDIVNSAQGAATASSRQARPTELELRAWIEECIADVRDRGEFTVPEARQKEFLLLFGLVGRTVRFSDAYLKLSDLGCVSEAVPLARVALEHAVTAQWTYIVEGGVGRYHRSAVQGRHDHYAALADWLDDVELRVELERLGPTPEGKRLPPFMNMLREVDEGKFLETTYHVLSQQVHVTHSAVTSFLGGDEDKVHIDYDKEYPYAYQLAYGVAVACMLVRWIVAHLTDDDTLLGVLDKKSDALILPMNLIDSVPPEKRRGGF